MSAKLFLLLSLITVSIIGCSGATDAPSGLVPISGEISIDGTPLTKGTVTLIPKDGGPAYSGNVNEGQFEVNYSASAKGVPAGSYSVIFRSEEGIATMDEEGNPVEPKSLIPDRYSDPTTSGFSLEASETSGQKVIYDLFSE